MEPAPAFLNLPMGGKACPVPQKWPASGVRARQTCVHGAGHAVPRCRAADPRRVRRCLRACGPCFDHTTGVF